MPPVHIKVLYAYNKLSDKVASSVYEAKLGMKAAVMKEKNQGGQTSIRDMVMKHQVFKRTKVDLLKLKPRFCALPCFPGWQVGGSQNQVF